MVARSAARRRPARRTASSAEHPLDQAATPVPPALVVQRAQDGEAAHDGWSRRGASGTAGSVVPAAAGARGTRAVVVAAAERRRAQSGDDARPRRWGRRSPEDRRAGRAPRCVLADERASSRPGTGRRPPRAPARAAAGWCGSGAGSAMSRVRAGRRTPSSVVADRPPSPDGLPDRGGDLGGLDAPGSSASCPVVRRRRRGRSTGGPTAGRRRPVRRERLVRRLGPGLPSPMSAPNTAFTQSTIAGDRAEVGGEVSDVVGDLSVRTSRNSSMSARRKR